jgi:hypothetical protein
MSGDPWADDASAYVNAVEAAVSGGAAGSGGDTAGGGVLPRGWLGMPAEDECLAARGTATATAARRRPGRSRQRRASRERGDCHVRACYVSQR